MVRRACRDAASAVARGLLDGAGMRSISLPALSLLSLLCLAPEASAKKPAANAAAIAATSIEVEVVELDKDGTRRPVALVLALSERQGGRGSGELTTKLEQGERKDAVYYWLKVEREDGPEPRFYVLLKRGSNSEFNNPSLRVEVTRVLTPGAATQLGRVTRPDGGATVVTATVR